MTRAELIAALMETHRTAFSDEPENSDFPARLKKYLRSLTTEELQWMYDEQESK